MTAYPKNPSARDKRLRDLARGEECTVQFDGGYCDPSTTVWAHSNRLADGKGCSVGSAERASAWFAENWPSDLVWPLRYRIGEAR